MSWSARDWRQFTALNLLTLAAVPLTLVMAGALWVVHLDRTNHLAFWLGQSAAGLILTVLIGVSSILGRRTFKLKVGGNEINATGEDAERVLSTGDAT